MPTGNEAPGFPKLTGGWVTGGAVFGTLGSIPDQVLVAGTREGELFIWQTAAPASGPRGAWPQVHQNLWNTDDYSGGSALPEAGGPSASFSTAPLSTSTNCRPSRSNRVNRRSALGGVASSVPETVEPRCRTTG